jgi:urease accessory protein
MWLASPALPVGGFSYSEGLEAAVESGRVTHEAQAAHWLTDQLNVALARGDLAVMAKAVVAWRRDDRERVAELNRWVWMTRETAEFRLQCEQMGRSLLDWLRNQEPANLPSDGPQNSGNNNSKLSNKEKRQSQINWLWTQSPSYPIAFALAAADVVAPVRDVLLAFGFGWAENMVQAALKAVPLGQSAGQRILAQLADALPVAVDRAMALPDSHRAAFSPLLAIVSAQHEAQYSRLFRS